MEEKESVNVFDTYATKDDVNSIMAQIVEMLVGLEERLDAFEEKVEKFNRRSGIKF